MRQSFWMLAVVLTACGPELTTDPVVIDDSLSEDLRFLREEEKLAHDVYVALQARWSLQTFGNIAASEQTHTDAVMGLLTSFGIEDPVAGKSAGQFENATLQQLYAELVEKGSKSQVDALVVGATIEDLDLADLERFATKTARADVLAVYDNLARGSRNHLRSYVGQLGGAYQPQFISRATYDGILTTPTERGGH
ncbi:MAG: DUF2202 domain-containing protein [Myxococcaceae bacterium]